MTQGIWTVLGVVAVALLGGLVVSYEPSGIPIGREPARMAVWILLIPLGFVAPGLLRGFRGAAIVGAAVGIAVLPWATALTFSPSFGAPKLRQIVALVGSGALLLASLRVAVPGDSKTPTEQRLSSRGRRWIRWCLILNFASVLNLYLFVIAYSFGATWQVALLAILLASLLGGVVLLARGVTGGLLLLAVSATLMVPGAALFVGAEAKSIGEAWLFACLFAPGVFVAWGTVGLLARPLLRHVRESP